MARSRGGSSNGGIGGSGVFGLIGTTIRCDSKDDSYYCNFMKFVNVVIMLCFLAYVAYLVWPFIAPKRGRR